MDNARLLIKSIDIRGDAERACEAGRADAACRDIVAVIMLVDAIGLKLARGAQACIDGGYRHLGQSRYELRAMGFQAFQYVAIDGRDITLIGLLGGRPDNDIAENRAAEDDALGALGRHRKDRRRDEARSLLVE